MVFETIETILNDAGATHAELVMAKDLAETINLLDASNPECAGGSQ